MITKERHEPVDMAQLRRILSRELAERVASAKTRAKIEAELEHARPIENTACRFELLLAELPNDIHLLLEFADAQVAVGARK